MKSFRYVRPTSLSEALDVLEANEGDVRILSGGTDLVVGLRSGKFAASVLLDVKDLEELQPGVREEADTLVIGATTVMTDAVENERLQALFPALVDAALTVGSIQIRNRATFAGNICNASPAADTVLPLLVYGAQVELVGVQGTRRVPLDDFILGPGRTDRRPTEILTSVVLPRPRAGRGAGFARMTRRRGVDLATINVACQVEEAGEATFAFGAAGPRAFLVRDDSGQLADPSLPDERQEELLQRLVDEATPISDIRGSEDYRKAMLLVLAGRTLQTANERRTAGASA